MYYLLLFNNLKINNNTFLKTLKPIVTCLLGEFHIFLCFNVISIRL